MKLKRKILTFSMSAVLLASVLPVSVYAENSQVNFNNQNFETVVNEVEFQGKTFLLLDTYADSESAYQYYYSQYEDMITNLKEKYDLPDLAPHTASVYKQGFLAEYAYDYSLIIDLLGFLDIYENPEENSEIGQELSNYDNLVENGEFTQDEAINQAKLLLPAKDENGNNGPFYAPRNSGINLKDAVAYAEKYATEINPTYGEEKKKFIFPADCTNFASQILYAGGIPMDSYDSVHKGWWWKAKKDRSVSWVNANVFKNYMGSGYNTSSWSSFVSNVRAGDFIGVDFKGDGSVDHIGFVCEKSNGKLKIAQHTRNYLDWNGGWPDYDGEGKYYRVRR